jgi:hypothetical protein
MSIASSQAGFRVFTKGKLWPTVIRGKQSEDKSTVHLLADGALVVRSRTRSWHISKWDAHFVQAAVSQRGDTTVSEAPESIRELWRWYCSQLNEHESVPYKDRLVDLLMLLVSSMDLAQVYGLSEPSHFEDGNADPYVPVGYYITSWHQADEGGCEDLPGSDFAMRLVSAAIAGRCFMVSNILPHSDESLLHSIYFLGCGPQDLQAGDVIRSSHKDETALFLRPRGDGYQVLGNGNLVYSSLETPNPSVIPTFMTPNNGRLADLRVRTYRQTPALVIATPICSVCTQTNINSRASVTSYNSHVT